MKYSRVYAFAYSICIFTASLSFYTNSWGAVHRPYMQLLDFMVSNGREIAVMALAFTVVLTAFRVVQGFSIPRGVLPLISIQLYVTLKMALSGNVQFAFLALLIYLLTYAIVLVGLVRLSRSESGVDTLVLCVATSGIVFLIFNSLQAFYDVSSLALSNGRFVGTTGNPLHAAVYLALVVPFCISLSLTWSSTKTRLFWLITAFLLVCIILWTGSRTGMVMLAPNVIFLIAGRGGYKRIVMASIIFFMILLMAERYMTNVLEDSFSRGLNREERWNYLVDIFSSNPLLGGNFDTGRIVAAESSWLSLAAGGGLVGLFIGALFFAQSLRTIFVVVASIRQSSKYVVYRTLVVVGLSAFLIGTIFEGYLLGILNAPLLILYVLLTLGSSMMVPRGVWHRSKVNLAN